MTKEMTNFERLSIIMQASVHPRMTQDYGIEPDFIAEVVSSGNEWALTWKYDSFLAREPHSKDAVVAETCDIFDVFRHIQDSANTLGMPRAKTSFPGFDANNDAHYGVADVLVRLLGRYADLRGACNNSHSMASIGRYREMVQKHNKIMQEDGGHWRELTQPEIEDLLS